MIHKCLLAIGLIISGIGAHGQSSRQMIEFTEFDLPNGLHVILHEDHTTPNVAVTVLYHVGSKNEKPDRTGFAHFFEHLLFEGSENIGRGEFDKYVENAGGTLNANTSKDRTFYHEVLPSNYLELGLWLESERMLHAKVDAVGIETQRKVVKEEKRQRVDNQPYGNWLGEVCQRMYRKHPYQWQPIGSMEHLDAATEADYVGFYKTYYVPNNATLSIAGDLDIASTKALVEKYFSDIPRGNDVPRPSVVEPALGGEIRDTVYDNIQLPAVIMAYHSPKQSTKDAYALEMLSYVLSRGQSARLTKTLVDDKQLALQAFSFYYGTEDPGLFNFFALCNMGIDPAEVEKVLEEEIDRLKSEPISDMELTKIQNIMETRFVTGFASIQNRAEYLANYHVYGGNASLINTEVDRYMAVTKDDIMNAAKTYLNDNNRVVLYYQPKK
ncbi:MAG: insulinase family protein [Bacteroidetes bacterium]|jgi:predicted Zn-dependent peptidase|nr:insulinase family protein [Bacteroidota bacterium]